MSIFLDENSRIIVQGLTGSEGTKHAGRMLASGSDIVGGVNPRKAGTTVEIEGRELLAAELDRRTGLAGVDAADDVGTRLDHEGGVLGAHATGHALDDDLAVLVEVDRHWFSFSVFRPGGRARRPCRPRRPWCRPG